MFKTWSYWLEIIWSTNSLVYSNFLAYIWFLKYFGNIKFSIKYIFKCIQCLWSCMCLLWAILPIWVLCTDSSHINSWFACSCNLAIVDVTAWEKRTWGIEKKEQVLLHRKYKGFIFSHHAEIVCLVIVLIMYFFIFQQAFWNRKSYYWLFHL